MYCKHCGKQLEDNSTFCVNCGQALTETKTLQDKPSFGFAVCGFLVPLLGLILYLIYEKKEPKRAKSALKGVVVKVVAYVLILVITLLASVFINHAIVDNIDVYQTEITEECDVELGEFKIVNKGYIKETSLEVLITNNSNEQSNIYVTVEAVDEEGVRIGTDFVMADRLNPNQKFRAEAFQFVPEDEIERYKNATFKVLEVKMY